MPATIAVLVCGDLLKAAAAQKFLKKEGFLEANITVEETASYSYDSAQFGGPTGKDDFNVGAVVVTGRK